MTKQIMKQRDSKKEAATRNSDPILLEEYRRLRNRVKDQMKLDQENYYHTKLHDNDQTIKGAWKTVYQALGKSSNLAPVQLVENGQAVVLPRSMANTFNTFSLVKAKNCVTA